MSAGPNIGVPPIRNFSAEEYGGHIQVWCAVQDRRGVIYFGTTTELVEFDGTTWRTVKNSEGILVRSLSVGAEGTVYVGGANDLGYIKTNNMGDSLFVSLREKIPKEHGDIGQVFQVYNTHHGVYFITEFLTFRWAGQRFKILPFGGVFSASVDGRIYFPSKDKGIRVIANGKMSWLPGSASWVSTHGRLRLFPFPGDQKVLVSTEKSGLMLFTPAVVQDATVNELVAFPNQAAAYIGGHSGIALLSDSTLAIGTIGRGIVVLNTQGQLLQVLESSLSINPQIRWAATTTM